MLESISDIEKKMQEFLFELKKETYLHYSGKKKKFDLIEIYSKYEDIFTFNVVDTFSNRTSGLINNGQKHTLFLAKFVTDSYLNESVKEIDSLIAEQESTGIVSFEEKEIPYRSLLGEIFNAENQERCYLLDRLRREFISKYNNERWKRVYVFNQKAKEIGYDNYVYLCGRLKNINMISYYQDCKEYLVNTHDKYFDYLNQIIKINSFNLKKIQRSDIFLIARAKKYDSIFSINNLLPSIDKTLNGLGIILNNQENVQIDTEDRPGKASRPFCIALDPPNNIHLITKPIGGREDYVKLYHEMGHAQHWAHIKDDLPFIFKCLGDYSVTEGYALLFQSFLHNPQWVHQNISDQSNQFIKSYLKLADFLNFYLIRRYVVKFMYEYDLFSGNLQNPSIYYSQFFTENLGVAFHQEDFLLDVDVGFYSLNYIRAWLFENRLRNHLANENGEYWFCNKKSGDFLKKMWRDGQKNDVEECIATFDKNKTSLADLHF